MNYHLANVHPEAVIGKDVIIEPFATVAKDVVIGDGTSIAPNAVIMNGARIGKNCQISPGAVISNNPQDLKFKGEQTYVEIGDNTIIREFVTINRGTSSTGKTVVGSDSLIMSYVHIAHDCVIGNNVILGGYTGLAGEVKIDDWAIISSSLVHQFVHIGCHAMVSGGSLVRKDIPPYVKAAREPLAFVGINSVGLRRRSFSNEIIADIQEMYRLLYQNNMNHSQAIEYIETHINPSAERDIVVQFVRDSKRGIMKGYMPE
jgi:UDP-N-acetylglucosamine acyltransferase